MTYTGAIKIKNLKTSEITIKRIDIAHDNDRAPIRQVIRALPGGMECLEAWIELRGIYIQGVA